MSDDSLFYSIQEVSELLAIPVPKLRRWDEQGVLKAQRTSGGHRRYARELIDQLAANPLNPDKATKELATIKKSLAEKRRIIDLLLESEHRYRDLVETSHDMVYLTDSHGRIIYVNNAAQDIFGLAPKELIGRCFFDFEADNTRIMNRRFFSILKRKGEVRNCVTQVLTARGEKRWIHINARIVQDDNGLMKGIRATIRDITEQQLTAQRIEYLALHDALTDLPNRLALEHEIDKAIAAGTPGALLFLELDSRSHANESYGDDAAAERLIKGVASALQNVASEISGQLFRIGVDKFAIHSPSSLRKRAAQSADRALGALKHYRVVTTDNKRPVSLSASIGIALYPFHGADATTLFANTHRALYQARELGSNRYALFDKGGGNVRSTHKRVTWAKKLRDALDEDRLELFAQPAVRLADRVTVNNEILVRMRDENGRIVQPVHFIELAESLDLVQEIDMRVVEKLLFHLHQHELMGKKVRYFVNLSRVSIADARWMKRFVEMLSVSKASPNQLVFEVKESAAMAEVNRTLRFIRQLKEMGCRFALDDFGGDFSSFYYLKRFDVDYLKIDGKLIRDLADGSNRAFVSALNEIARSMRKQVIAESVESDEVLRLLVAAGTQYAQGYLFQQPLPLAPQVHTELSSNAMTA